MKAVGTRFGAAQDPPLPQWLRAGSSAALALLLSLPVPPPIAAQAAAGWAFQDDAFADLWFHGLAVVGFHGDGAEPLYDPGYADAVRRARAGEAATLLEARRGALLDAFRSDPAYEVLHFVPLYFAGVGREGALGALRAVAGAPRGVPTSEAPARLGVQVVAGLLPTPAQRRTLGIFLEALDGEWSRVVEPRRAMRRSETASRMARLQAEWAGAWAAPLRPFLSAEGTLAGTVFLVPALGREGRFLERGPLGGRPLVVVGIEGDGDPTAALSSLTRELCYPAVRRAFAPFKDRIQDRKVASRASDLAATRCGEALLERHAPARLANYRVRFGIPTGGMGPGFLSASGAVPDAATWEGRLEEALLRELHLLTDEARTTIPPVGRK